MGNGKVSRSDIGHWPDTKFLVNKSPHFVDLARSRTIEGNRRKMRTMAKVNGMIQFRAPLD